MTPKLKGSTETITIVEYGDLDKFINEAYGTRHYESIAAEEWGNDEMHSFDMAKDDLDEDDIETIESFKQGKFHHYITRALMQDLVNRDILPEGKYIVNVSW